MRYHYLKPTTYFNIYGQTYVCNHPVYDKCTLYIVNDRGLAVIQQRFDVKTKKTWWGEIDTWLTDDIYLNSKFKDFFKSHSAKCVNRLYPTVTIRQLMWALKMKPIKRERWETVFDNKNI